jgi:hypothetical protein
MVSSEGVRYFLPGRSAGLGRTRPMGRCRSRDSREWRIASAR